MKKPVGATVAVALSVVVAAVAAVTAQPGHGSAGARPSTKNLASEAKGSVPNIPACANRTSSTLAYLAIEAPASASVATSTMTSSGLSVSRPQVTAAGNEVVVAPQTSSGTEVTQSDLSTVPGITNVAPLAAQSPQPAYNSCLQDLSDSASDQQLKTDAMPVIESDAGVTAPQLNDALWTVSDDPLQSNTEVVTAQVQGPPLPPFAGQPANVTIYSVKPYLAFVNTSTNTVTGVIDGPWNK